MSAKSESSNSEIHEACQAGDEAAVKRLVQQKDGGGGDINARGENGMTGLHFAAMKGEVGIVKVTKIVGTKKANKYYRRV